MLELFTENRRSYNFIPPVLWGSVIFLFSVLPSNEYMPLVVGAFDKLAHFFEFCILSILILRSIYRTGHISWRRNILFTLILGVGYGILMELLQNFVPGREASSVDVLFDAIGTAVGVITGKFIIWQK